MKIVIIDYGMGNLHSVYKAFLRIGLNPLVSDNPSDILSADKIILPGVGHFASGMERLKSKNIIDVLQEKVLNKNTPVLGICLGMQLFTDYSEEGNAKGLGWIKANTCKFNLDSAKFKIPHMGWNTLTNKKSNPIFEGIHENEIFYFVHSYRVLCDTEINCLAKTNYGGMFDSCIVNNNILGFQFHPEKSHRAGLALLSNFIKKFYV